MASCFISRPESRKLFKICLDKTSQANRTLNLDAFLRSCGDPIVAEIPTRRDVTPEAATQILFNKELFSCLDSNRQVREGVRLSLEQIYGYNKLLEEVESLRATRCCSDNEQHEQLLLKLWRSLKPDTDLEGRLSKSWSQLGFQGIDPMTDFRGMGLLSLLNLVFFAENNTQTAQDLVNKSFNSDSGYSFAVLGINLTDLAYRLLLGGHLKTHLFNTVYKQPVLDDFNKVYVHLFVEFDRFWFDEERPASVMQFSAIKDKFETKLKQDLDRRTAALKLSS